MHSSRQAHRAYPLALLAGLLSWIGANPAGAACTLYEHTRYKGEAYFLDSGEESNALPGSWNDRVSSVKVDRGCKLTVYQHRKYAGDRRAFTGDASDVGSLWNDEISSARCSCDEMAGPRSCELFQHMDFGGGSLLAESNAPYRRLDDGWNDQFSSLKVPRGCRLEVYQDYDFRGASRTVPSGSYRSVGDDWNDQISSLRCICRY